MDDDQDYQNSLKTVLKSAGHKVKNSATVEATRESLGRDDITLMLVYYLIPEMSKEGFLRGVRSDIQSSSALVITDASFNQIAGLLGLDVGYLKKTIFPGVLLQKADFMLKKGGRG